MVNKIIWKIIGIPVILLISILAITFFLLSRKPETPPSSVQTSYSPTHEVIGKSVEGRDIESFKYGDGPKHVLFVGGMHGGYEWNAVLLAYQVMDYLQENLKTNPQIIPAGLTLTIIPDLNPDGVYRVTGKVGRFNIEDVSTSTKVLASGRSNTNGVDLNRNFDCKWQANALWQNKPENAGTAAFSEPESLALKNFVEGYKPIGVIFWHSASGSVYASECKAGILPETLNIMNTYAKASGYSAIKKFDSYPVTGDSEGWLASLGIPALTVELKTHTSVEFDQNLAGVKAILNYYGGVI